MKTFNAVLVNSRCAAAPGTWNQTRRLASLANTTPAAQVTTTTRLQSWRDPSEYERQEKYWARIPAWKNTSATDFLSHSWQMSQTLQRPDALFAFLRTVLPVDVPEQRPLRGKVEYHGIRTAEDFIASVQAGIKKAPMAFRLSPHVLSVINWQDPLNDPVRRQFIPLDSSINVSHPATSLDPLQETNSSPLPGLVHRYHNKALFLSTSICPVYCRFCTRSYSIGTETETVKKMRFLPVIKKWESRFQYIEANPHLVDIVLSGGDSYLLEPEMVRYLGERLLSIPHIRRIRFATKGLAVSPSRMLDPSDAWMTTVIELSKRARSMGKHVCIHTHFNNKQEITWITRAGARRLYEEGVTVRNQTVLLHGVNNSIEELSALVHELTEINIEPYYVYQGDMIPGAEDLRTPLSDSLELELQLRDQTAGFLLPRFVTDVPVAGKRPSLSAHNYDRIKGTAQFASPKLVNGPYSYWDPLWSLSEEGREQVKEHFASTTRKSEEA